MMLAVGHITLGYITGKILGKAMDQNLNIPVLWTLSLLPDIDLIIPGLRHRGPTHSIIVALLFFVPFLIINARKTAPYFTALATHSLIGDYFTDTGITLFWPLSPKWVKYGNTIMMGNPSETYIETALFAMLIATLILSGDLKHLFNPDRRNIIFIIPLCTIFLPAIFKYPIEIPEPLIIIHLILLAMIVLSLAMSLIQAISTVARRGRIDVSGQ